jgi:hypothetical protein
MSATPRAENCGQKSMFGLISELDRLPDRNCRTRRVEFVDAEGFYVQSNGNRRFHYDNTEAGMQKKSLMIRQEIAKPRIRLTA